MLVEEHKVQEVLVMVITMKLVNIYKEELLVIIQVEVEDQEELAEDGMEEVYINHQQEVIIQEEEEDLVL
jgi:hypothetical protein